ncbi:MAG: cysteine-rich CWC family protein [Fimbriimonadales bacterium]
MPEPIGDSICPECGQIFQCAAAAGESPCWCAKLPHVLPCGNRDAACFCPECLGCAINESLSESDRIQAEVSPP